MGKIIGTYTEEYGPLRFIMDERDLLVCATDIARSLGYKRPNDAIRDHCRWTEKRTVPNMDGTLEYARFVGWYEALQFVRACCLPGADVYEEFLSKLIDKYWKEYTSYSKSNDLDFDDYDDDEDEEDDNDYDEGEEDDDCDSMDEYDPDSEADEYDRETEILAVTQFVVLLVGMIIDVLYDGDWFAFNDREPEVAKQKSQIARSLTRMMDIAHEALDGMFNAA